MESGCCRWVLLSFYPDDLFIYLMLMVYSTCERFGLHCLFLKFSQSKPFFFTILSHPDRCLINVRCRYEFRMNHAGWFNSVKPRIGLDISTRVLEAINSSCEDIKSLYKVRTELRAALKSLTKVFIC